MAEIETGWTRQDPKVDGVYWWRANGSDSDPDIHFVQGESFYQVGFASSEFVANFGGEWLGPISPADFEELTRLRDAAEAARTWICRVSNQYFLGVDDPHEVLVQLRKALDPELAQRKGGQS